MAQPTSPDSLTLLLTVSKKHNIKIGRPPMDLVRDNYHRRAEKLGNLTDASHVICNPEGELFCVQGRDLYTGPLPPVESKWIDNARIVGKAEWSQFKILLFHPKGELYGTTKDGWVYNGPQPDDPGVNWMCQQAKRSEDKNWEQFRALFFDAAGYLYAVGPDDSIIKGYPVGSTWTPLETQGDRNWLKGSHFIAFCSAGNLWCVNNKGNIYKTSIMKNQKDDREVIKTADKIGEGFNDYSFLCFTKDKTIKRIISLDFDLEKKNIVYESPETIKNQTFDNKKSTTPLKYTFTYQKTVKKTSTFTRAEGFQFGADVTFKVGVPVFGMDGKLTLSTSETKTWAKTDEIQEQFTETTHAEVPPGKGIRLIASVEKVKISVPYRAKVETVFGFKTDIEGMWNGVDFCNLMVKQEDVLDPKPEKPEEVIPPKTAP